MSSNLPLRAIRVPPLRQQCLLQRPRNAYSPCAFSTSLPRAFTASSSRLRGASLARQDKSRSRAAARSFVGAAPRVEEMKSQQEGVMADDIGLLQDTVVRASWKKLPKPWSSTFWGYMWRLLKSYGTGLYSRSMYNRCIHKHGWRSYLAIDRWNKTHIQDKAIKLYTQLYVTFAKGDMSSMARFCLPPVFRSFQNRIAARGPLTMEWQLTETPSTKIVSHRASMLGEDQPDTAYRQVVIRIESTQKLTIKHLNTKGPKRLPVGQGRKGTQDSGYVQEDATFPENGKPRKVVEYLVLQIRVIKGQEDDWKIWGFTQESTPAKIEEDDAYWRKTLDSHAIRA